MDFAAWCDHASVCPFSGWHLNSPAMCVKVFQGCIPTSGFLGQWVCEFPVGLATCFQRGSHSLHQQDLPPPIGSPSSSSTWLFNLCHSGVQLAVHSVLLCLLLTCPSRPRARTTSPEKPSSTSTGSSHCFDGHLSV
jgi:hypothetical protein